MTPLAQDEAVRMVDLRKSAVSSESLAAIDNLLKSIEGMQGQMAAMTELIVAMEQRICDLECVKPPKRKLISVNN